MAFDPNKDYWDEMKKKAAEGDEAGFNAAQTSRNEKINTNGLNYATTNYTMSDFAKENGVASVPAVSQANPTPGKTYDYNSNYTQNRQDNEYNGKIAGAMYDESMHNEKDGDLNLGYGATDYYNYQDYEGLGGQKEAKYNEIVDYYNNGFTYDYTTDPIYQSILAGKEKEANKSYQDMLAQYSTSFDGDIPVNMLNKAVTTKSEIIDQADNYITDLYSIAKDIYDSKGNQLWNQYSTLDDEEQSNYDRWYTGSTRYQEAVEDEYTNRINEEATAYSKEQDAQELEYQNWYQNNTVANTLMTLDPTLTYEEAFSRAKAINFGT